MSLELHNLKPSQGSRRGKKRLGRGNASGHGTTATRGTKGQRARQGGRKGLTQLGVKHFVARLPKVRGFKSFKKKIQAVNLSSLLNLPDGTIVTNKLLANEKIIFDANSPVKIIGRGQFPKKLIFKVQAVSQGAREAIIAAGGQIELISVPKAVDKKKR